MPDSDNFSPINKLEPMKFTIVGCGGIGNWLSKGLAMMLNSRAPGSVLMLVDGDNYEPKNVDRQLFSSVGNKAEVLYREMQPLFDQIFIVAEPSWVVPDDSKAKKSDDSIAVSDLLVENDIVFSVVDNHAARKTIFDAAKNYSNIDVFTGGNDDGLYGSVYHYRRRDGEEVTDHPSFWHEELVSPPDRNPGELSCQERAEIEGGTQTVAANMAVASFLLAQVNHFIFDGNDITHGEVSFDLGLGIASGADRLIEQLQTEAKVAS